MASLIRTLNGLFSGGPYYVRISRTRLTVRDATGGGIYDDEPLVALSADSPTRIVGVGSGARGMSGQVVNPFGHPRVLIDDFTIAEKLLAHAIFTLSERSFIAPAPIVVIHPIGPFAGGLTSIERRALMELGAGVGAREVHIWEGRDLSDLELKNHEYRRAT